MLYTYKMTTDSGCAPNPYQLCTLAICKPKIRKSAKVGDYIVGFGSKFLGSENKIIYIMKVTNKLTFDEYNWLCKKKYLSKIKNGDCIYYRKNNKLIQRFNKYHGESCIFSDTSSPYVLLSDNYLYFGSNSINVSNSLKNIIPKYRGHKSKSNEIYLSDFENWFNNLNMIYKNNIQGEPHNYVNNKLRC